MIGKGRVSDSMGTYECVLAGSDEPSLTDSALDASLNSYCHVVPKKFVTVAYFPSGIMVKWFHDLLNDDRTGELGESDRKAENDFSEAYLPEGPTGLSVTPHLIGTCNPEFNPHARGVISGLGPGTTRGQLYKGILEGLACELSLITDLLSRAIGDFGDIYVSGGGSRSALGLKLRAALTGRRLHVMNSPESVCLGTAILAGVATGEYKDINEAIGRVVHEITLLDPDPMIASSYADQMNHYRRLRAVMVTHWNCGSHKEER